MRKPNPYRCDDWPHCDCHRMVVHWQWAVRHDQTLTLDDLKEGATILLIRLSCIEHNCHDTKARRWASRELAAPIFRREKMKWLAEGGFE